MGEPSYEPRRPRASGQSTRPPGRPPDPSGDGPRHLGPSHEDQPDGAAGAPEASRAGLTKPVLPALDSIFQAWAQAHALKTNPPGRQSTGWEAVPGVAEALDQTRISHTPLGQFDPGPAVRADREQAAPAGEDGPGNPRLAGAGASPSLPADSKLTRLDSWAGSRPSVPESGFGTEARRTSGAGEHGSVPVAAEGNASGVARDRHRAGVSSPDPAATPSPGMPARLAEFLAPQSVGAGTGSDPMASFPATAPSAGGNASAAQAGLLVPPLGTQRAGALANVMSPGATASGDAGPAGASTAAIDATRVAPFNLGRFDGLSFGMPSLGSAPAAASPVTSAGSWANGPAAGSIPFASSATASGAADSPRGAPGPDLSRTNELLQQLLDEVRKDHRGFLPASQRKERSSYSDF